MAATALVELVGAGRFAIASSGDHGTEWCKSFSLGCLQCAAYSRLKAALEAFDKIEVAEVSGNGS